MQQTLVEQLQIWKNSLLKFKNWYPIYTWLGKAFKGTVMNWKLRSMLGGSLEFMLLVPLSGINAR